MRDHNTTRPVVIFPVEEPTQGVECGNPDARDATELVLDARGVSYKHITAFSPERFELHSRLSCPCFLVDVDHRDLAIQIATELGQAAVLEVDSWRHVSRTKLPTEQGRLPRADDILGTLTVWTGKDLPQGQYLYDPQQDTTFFFRK